MPEPLHPFLKALTPAAEALGARLLTLEELTESDLPLEWEGQVVGGLRRPDLHQALAHLLTVAEQEIGANRSVMTRIQKQQTVALLNEWGAFTLRKSVEEVAEALGVSRFTVYNYLEHAEANS
ncbi:MAG: helix-turn-helix domain-containing protein [Acidimicrobiales bacterium]|jgi:predicted transcriptional regulator YheO